VTTTQWVVVLAFYVVGVAVSVATTVRWSGDLRREVGMGAAVLPLSLTVGVGISLMTAGLIWVIATV